jgi:hypothetical protein
MHDFHRRWRCALALLGPILSLASAPAAADCIEAAQLIWTFEDDYELPISSHFGATLAMTEEGPGEAWIAAPQGGAWARYTRDGGLGGSRWTAVAWETDPLPQAFAAAGHGESIIRTVLDAKAGETSIVLSSGLPLITGIVGDVAALDTNGAVIAIGQPDHNGGAGKVLIYVRNPDTTLYELDHTFVGGSGLRLGTSVAVKDSFVLAGAPGFLDKGAVYVLGQGAEWFVWQRIDAPTTYQEGEEFGAAIAIDGQWLAIGSPLHDRLIPGGGQVDSGGVWMYRSPGLLYELDAFVRPSGIAAGDRFGAGVALRRLSDVGATLVAGSPREDHHLGNAGAAYLFLRSATGWSERLRLADCEPGAADNLGARVALNSHDVLVSAPNATASGVFQQGKVLVFRDVVPLLGDGFESGDLAAWNGSVP